MAAVYNDGNIPYGSRAVSINGTGYIADDISITRPTQEIKRTNELGEPNGWVATIDFVEGQATLQMPDSTTTPDNGDTFITDFGEGNETFYVTEVGIPENKDSDKKVTITFRKAYN